MDIVDRITEALSHAEADGRYPVRLLIGHREADELEAVLCRLAETVRGLLGQAPKLPLGVESCEIFDVPVERVDQDTLIGVVSEPPDGPIASKMIARHRVAMEYARGLIGRETWSA